MSLKQLILNQKPNFQIIDVRDDDYDFGKIVGAKNFPSCTFDETLEELTSFLKNNEKKKIVFHCFFSQARGPRCAQIFHEYINSKEPNHKFEILILEGGWNNFKEKFGNDKKLIEKI
eukprot:gene4453-7828_t